MHSGSSSNERRTTCGFTIARLWSAEESHPNQETRLLSSPVKQEHNRSRFVVAALGLTSKTVSNIRATSDSRSGHFQATSCSAKALKKKRRQERWSRRQRRLKRILRRSYRPSCRREAAPSVPRPSR